MTSGNEGSVKPRKWNLPLTYQPKIEPVKNGKCTQTIRVIGKAGPKRVGDFISLHGYVKGRGTPWIWRTPYSKICTVIKMRIFLERVWLEDPFIQVIDFCGQKYAKGRWVSWNQMDRIAALDGIVPPTGEALRDVLISKNGKIPAEGIEAQIIRWSQ